MTASILLLLAGVIYGVIGSLTDRGERIEGVSWFDLPHEDNRAARRAHK